MVLFLKQINICKASTEGLDAGVNDDADALVYKQGTYTARKDYTPVSVKSEAAEFGKMLY